MDVEPKPEHAWLQQLVGEWDGEMQMVCEPSKPAEVQRSRETVRGIGGLWVQMEGDCEMPDGGRMTMLLTLGYDTHRERFVGTWLGSVMSELWIYDITRESENKLVMAVEGPSMDGSGARTPYRDVIEWLTPDHRTLTSFTQGADGQWSQFMRVDYRRRR